MNAVIGGVVYYFENNFFLPLLLSLIISIFGIFRLKMLVCESGFQFLQQNCGQVLAASQQKVFQKSYQQILSAIVEDKCVSVHMPR